jgi:hypothetical protein
MSVPPLLAIMKGSKQRWRQPGTMPAPKELVLHMAVAKLLRDHCLPDWRWTHFPSGEKRDIRTATKLKQMGLQRGWPDFLLLSPFDSRQIHCLELKREGEDLTDEQREFGDWIMDHGGMYSVVWNMDMVLTVLDVWGCLRVKYEPRQPA